jgi:aconitate hydratase
MVPFLINYPELLELGDFIFVPGIRKAVLENSEEIRAYCVKPDGRVIPFITSTGPLTKDERQIIADGCLINYYKYH